MPRYSGSTVRTDPAVPKMSSQAPGKILQLIFLWECRSLYGSLFERASVPDDRCPQPVGPPQRELMAPITAGDVDRSLNGMKDGPDGRRVKDMRAIPTNYLAAHFNLCLLSGYLPSILRGGETVLLPKVSRAGAPNEFRPIMISDIVVRCSIGSWHKGWRCIFRSVSTKRLSGLGTELPPRYGSCRRLSNTIRITSALSTLPLWM